MYLVYYVNYVDLSLNDIIRHLKRPTLRAVRREIDWHRAILLSYSTFSHHYACRPTRPFQYLTWLGVLFCVDYHTSYPILYSLLDLLPCFSPLPVCFNERSVTSGSQSVTDSANTLSVILPTYSPTSISGVRMDSWRCQRKRLVCLTATADGVVGHVLVEFGGSRFVSRMWRWC